MWTAVNSVWRGCRVSRWRRGAFQGLTNTLPHNTHFCKAEISNCKCKLGLPHGDYSVNRGTNMYNYAVGPCSITCTTHRRDSVEKKRETSPKECISPPPRENRTSKAWNVKESRIPQETKLRGDWYPCISREIDVENRRDGAWGASDMSRVFFIIFNWWLVTRR